MEIANQSKFKIVIKCTTCDSYNQIDKNRQDRQVIFNDLTEAFNHLKDASWHQMVMLVLDESMFKMVSVNNNE